MSNLIKFDFQGKALRTLQDKNGEPLFCLADICRALELNGTENITRQIKDEFSCPVLKTGQVTDPSGTKTAVFISEPQLYFVIMRSRAAIAKVFRQWVVNDVLPSIRKHGIYATAQTVENLLNNPDFGIKLLTTLKEERAQKEQALKERDEAIRTKAQIGSHREASAMGKASVAVRKAQKLELENNELKDRLGIGSTWRQVKSISFLKDFFNLGSVTYQQIGKQLKKISETLNLEVKNVPSEQYDSVNLYHIKAIESFKARLETDASFMAKYRKIA